MYGSFFARIAVCLGLIQGAGLGWFRAETCQGSEPVPTVNAQADEAPVEEVYREIFVKDCVVSFTASWCRPCRTQHAENKVLKDKKQIRVWEIDIDQHPRLWQHLTTSTTVPTTCIIKKGKVVNVWVGVTDHQTIENTFNKKP